MLVFHGVARQRWRKANGQARGCGGDGVLERLIKRGSDARRRVLGASVACRKPKSTGGASWKVWSRAVCVARSSSAPVSAPPGAHSAVAFGGTSGSTLPAMPSAMARNSRSANASARNRAPCWLPGRRQKPKSRSPSQFASYRDSAPKLANWLGESLPQGLSVFMLPELQLCRLRTSKSIARTIKQELKCRTAKVRAFPSGTPSCRRSTPFSLRNGLQVPRPKLSGGAKMRDLLLAKFQSSGCSIRQRQHNAI